MSGVKIQISEKRLNIKLYPILHCGQVKVPRKINFSSLVTAMYSGGEGGPQSTYFLTESDWQEVNLLTCCIYNSLMQSILLGFFQVTSATVISHRDQSIGKIV